MPGSRRALFLIAAAVVWFGLVLQYFLLVGVLGGYAIAAGRFVGYFTLLSNLLVALVLTACGLDLQGAFGGLLRSAPVAGAVALYIGVTGIIYEAMLRAIWNPEGWQYVADLILHDLSPLAYVGLWLAFMEKGGLSLKTVPSWLAFPFLFGAVALIRGLAGDFWAYPFLEIPALGVGRVAVNVLVMIVGFAALAVVLIGVARWREGAARATHQGS